MLLYTLGTQLEHLIELQWFEISLKTKPKINLKLT